MDWILLGLALAALAALHLYWRRRFFRAQAEARHLQEQSRREQSQVALHIQAQQEIIFNSMLEGLLLLDRQGRIQMANRALTKLFGIESDIRSRSIMEALRLHELDELVDVVAREKRVEGFELKISAPGERWLEVNGAAVLDGSGGHQGTVLVFHDLTRLKQLERVRTEFVANVSHELRTPLSLIKGYVETLIDGASQDPAVASRFLHTIDRNAERLKRLIEDLLTLSELESGRMQLNVQSVSLPELADAAIDDYQSKAAARGVRLEKQVPALRVRADVDRLQQVLGNLIDNAIKYGRPEGMVTIRAVTTQDRFAKISVHDDGPGIPPEALERIFERFYRVDKARSREQGGTGLGLAIVKHIVLTHGGKVWASSEPGKGTVVVFTLPLDRAEPTTSPAKLFRGETPVMPLEAPAKN